MCAARARHHQLVASESDADGNAWGRGYSTRIGRSAGSGDPDHSDRTRAPHAATAETAHRHGASSPAAGTGHELQGRVMTTQPQSPVTVVPPLPNRRNAELFLLGFAAVITTVALLIVEANQEQGLRWDLAPYTVAYLALFTGAHLAVRRFAPYADPLLLPVVALLNGLGLVMIHRLDLAEGELTSDGPRAARPTSRCCGRWSAWSPSRWW